jgi:hypothetical protein
MFSNILGPGFTPAVSNPSNDPIPFPTPSPAMVAQALLNCSWQKMVSEGKGLEGRGKWTITEQKIYISFLEENLEEMECRALRKTEKVYMKMAREVRTRTADQCRSHHQKVLKYHSSVEDIISYYK